MDEIMLKKAKNGDPDAFENIIKEHQTMIYNIAYRISGNRDDAFDISQDAMLKMYKNLQYFEGTSKLSTWIYRIVTNTALDFMRKNRRHAVVSSLDEATDSEEAPLQVQSDDPTPHEQLERKELMKAVENALSELSENHRAVLVLRDINGLSYEEIADILLCSEGTVKSRINRARKALQIILSKKKELF